MNTTHTNRFNKLVWIRENTTEKHINEMFLTELVGWLEEEEFNKFFEWHCRVWDIKTPFEEDEDDSPNEFIVTDDEMVPVA